eukprot:363538-Chlamydomonas_euryale.AAC.1
MKSGQVVTERLLARGALPCHLQQAFVSTHTKCVGRPGVAAVMVTRRRDGSGWLAVGKQGRNSMALHPERGKSGVHTVVDVMDEPEKRGA